MTSVTLLTEILGPWKEYAALAGIVEQYCHEKTNLKITNIIDQLLTSQSLSIMFYLTHFGMGNVELI